MEDRKGGMKGLIRDRKNEGTDIRDWYEQRTDTGLIKP